MARGRISIQLQTMAMKRANSAGSKPNIEMIPPGSHFSNILLQYQPGLIGGQLIRRYKRFLGDVEFNNTAGLSNVTVVHVPNTGPMSGLLDCCPVPAMLSVSESSKRKYPHTLEWLRPTPEGAWVGVHSAKANAMVQNLLLHRQLSGLPDYIGLQREVNYGHDGRSRVDFVLHDVSGRRTFVEVKSVTYAEDFEKGRQRIALFPDTVSTRAQRHVRELTALALAGEQAALVFLVQRDDCTAFGPCHKKDPEYGKLVLEAVGAGVRLVAAVCKLDAPKGIVQYAGELPILLKHNI